MFESSFHLVVTGWAGVALWMFFLWLIHLKTKNAAIVDVGWTLGLVFLALWDAWMGTGWELRRWLLAGLVTLWGARLGLYLLKTRILGGVVEDPRYTAFRAKWGTSVDLKFLGMFQFQGALDVLLSLPFLLVCQAPQPGLSWREFSGLFLGVVAILGESIADHQLKEFKGNSANKGKTCRNGLWNYSRHPNYFFEWLIWCAYFLYAMGAPWGWVSFVCPLLMFYFLFRVSGIPLNEAQAIKSKGEDYRQYQRTTSVFVPWFPLKG